MAEVVRELKGIMKSSGWTQEQLADRLGVSFASLNGWINGRVKPRAAMVKRIRMLYLAQDVTKDKMPTYVSLVNVGRELRVGDAVLLTKDPDNDYDDEAIRVTVMELDESVNGCNADGLADAYNVEDAMEVQDEDGNAKEATKGCNAEDLAEDDGDDDWGGDWPDPDELDEIEIRGMTRPDYLEFDRMYVANSANTVVRGTKSAGRIYDKFDKGARAIVCFVFHRMAIAKIVEWNYEA